jgi:hypothetical protein
MKEAEEKRKSALNDVKKEWKAKDDKKREAKGGTRRNGV